MMTMQYPDSQIRTAGLPERLKMPSKFLVCVDKRAASRTALRFACIKAARCDGLVDMLHVAEPEDFQSLGGIAEKMREEQREIAEALMRELCEEAYACSGITPSILLREGKIGAEILKTATEDVGVTMLVLGVTPKSPNRGRLIAWLSTRMGLDLSMPIMLVPGNLSDSQMQELG